MKPMTLNTMLFKHIHEGIEIISINDFHDDDDTLKEQPEQIDPIPKLEETQDPSYIQWQIFEEIPERVYSIQSEGYLNKNGYPLEDETTIKHLTSGEPPVNINDDRKLCDENGDVINYMDYDDYYGMNHNKYDLRKITKKISSKKFICGALIGSDKSTAICRWISSHKTEKFLVIIITVNIAEEFYSKLSDMDVKSIQLCVNENAFKKFHKAVHNEVNTIITTYNTVFKCLGDLIEEYYVKKQQLDYFLVIDEKHLLLKYIGLIEITKEYDRIALIIATADDIKHFACFRNYIIVYPCIKLIFNVDEQRAEIVNLNNTKRMNYDEIKIKIEDKKECNILKGLLKDISLLYIQLIPKRLS